VPGIEENEGLLNLIKKFKRNRKKDVHFIFLSTWSKNAFFLNNKLVIMVSKVKIVAFFPDELSFMIEE
jgi:hypothetical protein